MKTSYQSNLRQKGAVLIVSMLLLLVMTILALSISQTTTMEERMAGNARDMELAFQSAEASNKFAEFKLSKLSNIVACTTTAIGAGCDAYGQGQLGVVEFATQAQTYWTSNGVEYGVANSHDITEVNEDPFFIPQQLARVNDTKELPSSGVIYFEITSRSVGKASSTTALTQEVIATRTLQ
jgi:type IV pilus assembly protein PilX